MDSWHVTFGTKIQYKCQGTQYIEMPEPTYNQLDPEQNVFEIACLDTGVYDTPPLNDKPWPNCTQTVRCGQPPDKPVNGRVNGTDGHDGTIAWLNNAPSLRDTYDTRVEYSCAEGSQFDVAGDGEGDTPTLQKRCRWDKTWTPPATLPSCHVTHCIHPYNIPFDTYLEEVTAAWTPVNQAKQYRCKGWDGSRHTRFWQSDRTQSTFEITCLEDGSYSFDNERDSWPTCVEDITCEDEPPAVPTHSEYTLAAYDGTVTINSLVYPALTRTQDMIRNSDVAASTLPRNYMANLTYTCGSARRFIVSSEPVEEQSMSCQWDKTWSPTHVLEDCDWVACLKPPTPPASTGLRVTDWDGAPIPYGELIHFVCKRGLQFEEDPTQEEVTYTCQDGTDKDIKKGFFDIPELEEDWPRCLQGRYFSSYNNTILFSSPVSNTT